MTKFLFYCYEDVSIFVSSNTNKNHGLSGMTEMITRMTKVLHDAHLVTAMRSCARIGSV